MIYVLNEEVIMFKLVKTLAVFSGIVTSQDPHFKVRFCNPEEVALCIYKQEYNPFRRDLKGNTGFHAAAFLPETMEVLLQPKDVNFWEKGLQMKNNEGLTPIDLAIQPVLEVVNERIGFIDPNLKIVGEVKPEEIHHRLALLEKCCQLEHETFAAQKVAAMKRRKVRAFDNPDQG